MLGLYIKIVGSPRRAQTAALCALKAALYFFIACIRLIHEGSLAACLEVGGFRFKKLITRRVEYYRENKNIELPIDWSVMLYLYQLTNGRLRHIFGLLTQMLQILRVGDLADKVSLEVDHAFV